VAYGAIATYLNVSGQYGLADVIANGNVVDGDLITSSTVAYSRKLHVLLSPASVNFSDSRDLDYDKLGSLLDACRKIYAYTIIDAPRVSPKVAASLSAVSKTTLAVLQMSVKDIRVARELRSSLLDNGIPTERISLVVNRYRKKGTAVSLGEMQRAVGSDNTWLVRNDFRPAARSIDLGEPLAKAAPMSSLRKDIKKLLQSWK
jgi:pilus assembly protein CpaE